MSLILPFHLCRACHDKAGSWSLKRRGRDCQLGGCFGCGREVMLFCFAPERVPTGRKVTKPPPEAITASVDIPSRQIKDWPAGIWFGSRPEVIIKER